MNYLSKYKFVQACCINNHLWILKMPVVNIFHDCTGCPCDKTKGTTGCPPKPAPDMNWIN